MPRRLPRGATRTSGRRPHPLQTRFALARPDGPAFWRAATCEEIECAGHLDGWTSVLATTDPRVEAVRRAGRRFTEETVPADDQRVVDFIALTGVAVSCELAVIFSFPPGQACFRAEEHRIQVQREPLYLVRGHRPRQHTRADLWVEDMSERLDVVRDRRGG